MIIPRGGAARGDWRLPPQPAESIDRSAPVRFRWNGTTYGGFAGDTIASALAASGVRVFSRSLKYHRPRGILTADGDDPNCLVQVDDEPNVRAGHRLVRPGMAVRAQGVWPTLQVDVKALNQVVGRFLGPGFYYKTFIAPRQLWPTYERVIRRFSPGGPVPPAPPTGRYDQRVVHCDVLVVGGGPAGMAAAVGAAGSGASVLLVDEQHALGGHLRWADGSDRTSLAELRRAVAEATSIEVMTDAVVTGRYDGHWVSVLQRSVPGVVERLVKVRTQQIVVAAGLIERPYVVAGNDLPGVMLSTGVRRLINLYAVRPGARAVVLTANGEGDAAARDLDRAGVDVARVVDARRGEDIVAIRGRGRVEAVELSDRSTVTCDLVVTATGWTAPLSLLTMSGARAAYDPVAARFFATGLPDHVLAAGGVAGAGDLDAIVEQAGAAGRESAARATAAAGRSPVAVPGLAAGAHPALFTGRTDGMVDLAEDVSAKDLKAAVAEGYDSLELVKRYTTVTMGPTQGRLEAVNAIAVVAAATGGSIAETGTTTGRPPYAPVSLGALAGRNYQPVRHSPMHAWHVAHGARPLVAGLWIRPDHYGDPAAEVRTVRSAVGIIDVTPLGKFELTGTDVPRLLELLYVNRWQKLAVGSVRYGVMCTEDGVVFDDGVTGRLAPARYLLTCTSSGAGAVEDWIALWLQTEHPDWDVRVVPVTDAYASINVAGPRSRELVSRLVEDIDLAPDAFSYMQVRTGRVAGFDGCIVWRIGFTGELSFELHLPAGHGQEVWDRMLTAGADLGVGPFGIEAQRILRLEKGHLVVGQDTDGLTQGFSAGLDWAIKLDKAEFLGQPELRWQHERGDDRQLVGLQPVDGAVLPPESSQILDGGSDGGHIAGRITSSRMSPTLGRSICLGFVSARLARPGTVVTVRLPDGRSVPAAVMPQLAHVDPDGERLRG